MICLSVVEYMLQAAACVCRTCCCCVIFPLWATSSTGSSVRDPTQRMSTPYVPTSNVYLFLSLSRHGLLLPSPEKTTTTSTQVDGVDSACEILHRGFRNRHVGETAMNRESSRSHAVFTLVIQATEVVEEEGLTRSRVARFNLVDLAGSERQKDTQVFLDGNSRASQQR